MRLFMTFALFDNPPASYSGTRSQAIILVRKTGEVVVLERQAWSAQGVEEPVWNGHRVLERFWLQ